MRIALYCCAGSGRRSRYIADAMRQGLMLHGIKHIRTHTRFDNVCADVAIAYGWVHKHVFDAYQADGKSFAYFDLGYWNRRPSVKPLDGHYRLAINAWDTAHVMRRDCPADRFKALGIETNEPRLNGQEILIAGMSAKAAKVHGYDYGEWESQAKKEIERMKLKYPIRLRDKPNKKNKATETVTAALSRARILITRHSNAAVDALVAGVPFYAEHGVGALLSPTELTSGMIEQPSFSDEKVRNQLLYDIAYAQWSPPEMRTGDAWDHIRNLICA